jgi:acyl-CoA reductase-like NAD-dependent aldehyde dehydrogenase
MDAVRLANHVGGMWRAVDDVATLDDVDPATGEVSALVPLSGARQVREAVEAARAAQPEWRAAPPREELFGPLLTVVDVADLDAALEFLNGSRYGNAGAIFTQSGEAARRYRYGAEAGMLGVNVGVPAPVAWFPFSGWKDSMGGDLHANGTDAVSFYTRKKVVTARW